MPVHAGDGVMAKLVAATRRTAAVLVGALRAMNLFRTGPTTYKRAVDLPCGADGRPIAMRRVTTW